MRELRHARALTQEQLAGREFTKGFISALENGRTRLSMRTAGVLADRLGVSVGDLLSPAPTAAAAELELAVVRAEQRLAAAAPADAVALADSVQRRATGTLRARAARVHGRALFALGQPREALGPLEDALRAFRSAGERELATRTLFDIAGAYARLHQLGQALNLALECDRALKAGELVDRTLELQVLSFIAATFVALGDHSSADLTTERAIAVAEDVADPTALGRLYASLALTRQQQGDHEAAVDYARKSLEIYERLGQERTVAESWNTLAWIYVQRKHFARAADAIARAEKLARDQGAHVLEAYVLGTRAELAMARDELDEAVRLAEASAAHPGASARARANALLIRAQALARKRPPLPQLRAAFDAAIEALEIDPRLRAKAHQGYADALAERGQAKDAYAQARAALALLQPV